MYNPSTVYTVHYLSSLTGIIHTVPRWNCTNYLGLSLCFLTGVYKTVQTVLGLRKCLEGLAPDLLRWSCDQNNKLADSILRQNEKPNSRLGLAYS